MNRVVLIALVLAAGLAALVGAAAFLLGDDGPQDPGDTPVVPDEPDPVDEPAPVSPFASIDVPSDPFPRPPDGGAPFAPEGWTERLARVDFALVGRHLAAVIPLHRQMGVLESRGGIDDGTLHGRIMAERRPLFEQAEALHDDLGDEVPHGAFCHPLFVANALDAALRSLDRPLDDARMHRIDAALGAYLHGERKRREEGAEPDPDEWLLDRVLEHAGRRQAFYDAVLPLLTERQQDRLRPEIVRDRVALDLFSTTVMWEPLRRWAHVETDEEQFGFQVADIVRSQVGFNLTDEHLPRLWEMVRAWRRDEPQGFAVRRLTILDYAGHVKLDRLRGFTEASRRLYGAMAEEFGGDLATQLRGLPAVLVLMAVPQ